MTASPSLAKQQGTSARVLRSMAWSLPFVVAFWALRRSGTEVVVVAGGCCYLALYEAFSDRFSRRSRYLVLLPLFVGIIVAMFLLA